MSMHNVSFYGELKRNQLSTLTVAMQYTVLLYIPIFMLLLMKSLVLFSSRCPLIIEPRHEKTCLWGWRPGKTQTGLFSSRDQLGSWNIEFRKKRYYTIKAANNKGADQTAWMRRLICTFVVCIWQKNRFSHDLAHIRPQLIYADKGYKLLKVRTFSFVKN